MKYKNNYYILDIGNNALFKTNDNWEISGGGSGGYDFDTPLKWSRLGEVIVGEAAGDNSGYSVSLSSDGTIVAIGAPYNDENGTSSGSVRVYQWNASSNCGQGGWEQLGSDIDGETGGDNLGHSVSLSNDGTIVAISAPWHDGNGTDEGHVKVYKYSYGSWTQLGKDIKSGDPSDDDQFGFRVRLSSDGTIVAISANRKHTINGNYSGQVSVYQYANNAWTQLGQDIDGEAASDQSGETLSLSSDGTIVAIGAPNNDGTANMAGHVRVYEWTGKEWTQLGKDIDGEAERDRSGRRSISLSSDGTIVAIGATQNDENGTDSGHVRVYQWNGTDTWTQLGSDIDGQAQDDHSGWSTALSSDGTTLAISGFHSLIPGYIKIYKWNETEWLQVLLINGEAVDENFGFSVSLSGDGSIVAVGAKNYSDGYGSTHIYKLGSNEINSSESVIEPEEIPNNLKGGGLGGGLILLR